MSLRQQLRVIRAGAAIDVHETVRSDEQKQERDQGAAELARDAGEDLQTHDRTGAQAA